VLIAIPKGKTNFIGWKREFERAAKAIIPLNISSAKKSFLLEGSMELD